MMSLFLGQTRAWVFPGRMCDRFADSISKGMSRYKYWISSMLANAVKAFVGTLFGVRIVTPESF